MKTIPKQRLFDAFHSHLEQTYQDVLREANDTAQRARESEGANQSRYDTHKVEGSWLANSLSRRVSELEKQLLLAKRVPLETGLTPARIGSIINYVESGNKKAIYMIPFSQGTTIEYDSLPVLALSPNAPLGKLFVGTQKNETVTFREKTYVINDVY